MKSSFKFASGSMIRAEFVCRASNKQVKASWPACFFITMTFVLSVNSICSAQAQEIQLSVSPSVRVRSTIMNFFNLKGIRSNIFVPYSYERNLQTIEFGPKIELGNDLKISYTPFMRYGYMYSKLDLRPNNYSSSRVDKRGFILDQQFWLTKQVHYLEPRWYKPSAFAVGWGIVNTGKKVFISNGPINQFFRVELNTLDLAVSFASKSKKVEYIIGSHYLYNGFATNRTDKFIAYSATVGYKLFPFRSSK